jgi:hypothetical protein
MHTDASVSEVKIEADEHGLMGVMIDADPAKPYSIIERR